MLVIVYMYACNLFEESLRRNTEASHLHLDTLLEEE